MKSGYKGLAQDLRTQFKTCDSYEQFVMEMTLRGVNFESEQDLKAMRTKILSKPEAFLDICVEDDFNYTFNKEKLELLKEFWRNEKSRIQE